MNKLILGSVALLIFMFGFIYGLSILNLDGPKDITINPDKTLYGNEGEICSTSIISTVCKEGLVCATKDGRIDFDPNYDSGWCQNPNNLSINK